MNRVQTLAFRLIVASLVLLCFAGEMQAQSPSSQDSKKPADTKPDQKKAEEDPFAPESAPPLPAGMTGSDANDPRAKLKPGMYDAGEASMGMKHLQLLKKPGPFQLDSADPNSSKVQKTLGARRCRPLEDAKADAISHRSTGVWKLGPCLPGKPPVSR